MQFHKIRHNRRDFEELDSIIWQGAWGNPQKKVSCFFYTNQRVGEALLLWFSEYFFIAIMLVIWLVS